MEFYKDFSDILLDDKEFLESFAEIFGTDVDKVKDSGIIVKSLSLTNHDFSDEYNKAIEAKKVAEQGALKAKYDLERVTLEAEAQLKKQKSLNAMVLQEKAIDKWDGKLPQYYSGKELPLASGENKFAVKAHDFCQFFGYDSALRADNLFTADKINLFGSEKHCCKIVEYGLTVIKLNKNFHF